MRLRSLVAVLVLGGVLGAGPAVARFTEGVIVGGNTMSTATLQPPAGLSATAGCEGASPKVELAWTATVSSFADGYDVLRSAAEGGPYSVIAHVSGGATTSYSDTGLSAETYFYTVRSTAQLWISAESGAASATTTACA